MPRPVFGHKMWLTRPGSGGGGATAGADGPFQPWYVGNWYHPTFRWESNTTDNNFGGTGGANARSWLSPIYVGGPASWDRIGFLARWSSSPGITPEYYFLVYSLSDVDLMPVANLAFEGPFTVAGTVTAFENQPLTLSTTANWLGVGFYIPEPGLAETLGVRTGGVATAANAVVPYAPYGATISTVTWTPRYMIASTDDTGSAPDPTTYDAVGISAIPNFDTGVSIRRSA